MQHRAPNILTRVEEKAHGRRRRIFSQEISDLLTRGFGETFKKYIEKLCNKIVEYLGTSTQWSEIYDMSRWCESWPSLVEYRH
jgi:hypothetical protein